MALPESVTDGCPPFLWEGALFSLSRVVEEFVVEADCPPFLWGGVSVLSEFGLLSWGGTAESSEFADLVVSPEV